MASHASWGSHERYPRLLLALLTALSLALAVAPYDRADWLLENALLFAGVGVLVATRKALPLSRLSYTLVFVFMCLHAVGAHYTYSLVPYDDWFRAVTGRTLSSLTGAERNHYDRLVHFCFGLLAIGPVREIARRHLGLSSRAAAYIAPEFVLAFSACYEIFEWTLAVTMSPADAEAYNGQQGDPFDSQKDMTMAALGAIVGTMLFYLRGRFIAGRSRQ